MHFPGLGPWATFCAPLPGASAYFLIGGCWEAFDLGGDGCDGEVDVAGFASGENFDGERARRRSGIFRQSLFVNQDDVLAGRKVTDGEDAVLVRQRIAAASEDDAYARQRLLVLIDASIAVRVEPDDAAQAARAD